MKNATRILATLAASLATFVIVAPASPASAAEGCGAALMTDSELAQVDLGMRQFKVKQIVGGTGERIKAESTSTYLVRQWDWCTDGSYYANQWLVFERNTEGHWVLSEIR